MRVNIAILEISLNTRDLSSVRRPLQEVTYLQRCLIHPAAVLFLPNSHPCTVQRIALRGTHPLPECASSELVWILQQAQEFQEDLWGLVLNCMPFILLHTEASLRRGRSLSLRRAEVRSIRKKNTRKNYILSQCLLAGLTGWIFGSLLHNIGKCCAQSFSKKQTINEQPALCPCGVL
jgi:hypothetical protein